MSHASVLVAVQGDKEDVASLVDEQMAPFDENGDWFRKGSRWDYYVVGGRWSGVLGNGDVIQAAKMDLATCRRLAVERATTAYRHAMDDDRSPKMRELLYGVKSGDSLDDHVIRTVPGSGFPPFYAFLQNKRWNERERMGWFGSSAKTECEAAGHAVKRCLVRDSKTGAAIVSWGNDPQWDTKFYERFVRDVPAETWLVVVDYHV